MKDLQPIYTETRRTYRVHRDDLGAATAELMNRGERPVSMEFVTMSGTVWEIRTECHS